MSKYKFIVGSVPFIESLERLMEEWESNAIASGFDIIGKTVVLNSGSVIVMFEYKIQLSEVMDVSEQVDLEDAIKEIDEDNKTVRPKKRKR